MEYCCNSEEHCNLCGAQGWAVVLVSTGDGHTICSECAEERKEQMKNYRKYNDDELLKIVNDPLLAQGEILVQTIGVAPWGEDHLGFTVVDQEWLDTHSSPLEEDDPIVARLGLS